MMLTKTEAFDLLAAQWSLFEARLDTDKVTWTNLPIETLLGYSVPGSLNDLPVATMFPEFSSARFTANPQPARFSSRGVRKDGTEFTAELFLFPRVVSGVLVVLGVVIDVPTPLADDKNIKGDK